MAAQLPEELKKADLHRFVMRAAQLEKARPIVTYWCEYYVLQHVLSKSLHAQSEAASQYAVALMDKLEATKASNASNDAIVDDVAAKAYIENFALDTFNRADESQRTNKVTKQTADTFLAAVTFMDLLSIWGEVDREITAKSKFAKYHARRILQAIKAGKDPNATNPVVEDVQQGKEDGLDAELRDLEAEQNGIQSEVYQAPSVEDLGSATGPSASDGTPRPIPGITPSALHQSDYQVSPIDQPEGSSSRQNSVGGGYFPNAPSAPSAPTDMEISEPPVPDIPPGAEDMNPKDFYNTVATPPPAEPSAPSPESLGISDAARPGRPPPEQMTAQPPTIPYAQPPPPTAAIPTLRSHHASKPAPPGLFPSQPPPTSPHPPSAPQPAAMPTTGFRTDDEATMAAQKHARWAISALNFEDVNTAVKELRLALQSLGAG